ncbi:MAG: glycine cleavage system protein T [Acidobacteria bacterium]|nr:MAG: glycine cleavage system protein T [Acidobacteriota bacterium]PIE90743.1 MAG: glycine cleavage system protein T [Acidobacteriota bacterium]
MTDNLKRTPLVKEHLALKGKMVDFGGWYLPVQYTGLVEEHVATRTQAGLFDVSHMGEIRVTGKEAEALLDVLTTNAVTALQNGQIHYTVMLYDNGSVVDDLLIYRFSEEDYLLVVNASNKDKDLTWVQKQAEKYDVTVADESSQTAQLALQGPQAEAILRKLTQTDLENLKYYHFTEGEVQGKEALISRTGYTGEDGFEIYLANEFAPVIWKGLLEAGREHGLKPAGLGARDTLRLEARMALYGHEIDEQTSPLQAGLKWVVKLRKKADFIGKAALKEQRKAGLGKKIVGFEITGKGIPRQGYPVLVDGQEVGVVASGTFSPTLQKGIGTAFLKPELAVPDVQIQIQVRKRTIDGITIKGPFYQRPISSR